MTTRRAAVFFTAAALGAFGIAGCGSSSSGGDTAASTGTAAAASPTGGDQKQVNIAFFNAVAANAYTASVLKAIEKVAGTDNAKVTSFDAGFDQNKQISQMQDAITTGKYDAFIVLPVNGTVLTDVAQQAVDADIKLVAVFNNIGPDIDSIEPQIDGMTSVVAQRLSVNGQLLGEEIVKACEGIDPCTTVYMPGSFKQATEKIRLDALKKVVSAAPNVKLVASAEGGYLADPAFKASTDVLQANKNVDVFATSGDQMMTGIIRAVEDRGLSGKIKLIGDGTTVEGVKWVRDGTILADPVAVPGSEGKKAAELAIKATRGETVPSSVDSLTLSPIGKVATKETLNTPEGKGFTGEYNG
jgi:ribose transport system substrate-binding protein